MKAKARRRDDRAAELAQIHIAKKELGLDDDTYRDMLFTVARVRSSADLDFTGRKRVLAHLKSRGFNVRPSTKYLVDRPKNMDDADRGPSLKKIEALLADAGRPWTYVTRGTNGRESMVKRICGVDRIEFADVDGLHRLIVALIEDQRRRESRRIKATESGERSS
jgi:phage gp16-like protein